MTAGRKPYPQHKEPGLEQIFYVTIRESREGYFVEYFPPRIGDYFACLNLSILSHIDAGQVAESMERELAHWIRRFPIPLMVSAFGLDDSPICLEQVRPSNHLNGYIHDGEIIIKWGIVGKDEFPEGALSGNRLREVFRCVPFRTQNEIREQAYAKARQMRIGIHLLKAALMVWLVVIPSLVALLGWANPFWGLVVLVYSLGKAAHTGMKLTGHIRPSKRQQRDEEKMARMRHYYYHCEQNPEAFLRLRDENFTRDAERATLETAQALGAVVSGDSEEKGLKA